jgi:hypothetical protein
LADGRPIWFKSTTALAEIGHSAAAQLARLRARLRVVKLFCFNLACRERRIHQGLNWRAWTLCAQMWAPEEVIVQSSNSSKHTNIHIITHDYNFIMIHNYNP